MGHCPSPPCGFPAEDVLRWKPAKWWWLQKLAKPLRQPGRGLLWSCMGIDSISKAGTRPVTGTFPDTIALESTALPGNLTRQWQW